jgi:hypothetical protein
MPTSSLSKPSDALERRRRLSARWIKERWLKFAEEWMKLAQAAKGKGR